MLELTNDNFQYKDDLTKILTIMFEGIKVDELQMYQSIKLTKATLDYVNSVFRHFNTLSDTHIELYLWWNIAFSLVKSTTIDIEKNLEIKWSLDRKILKSRLSNKFVIVPKLLYRIIVDL